MSITPLLRLTNSSVPKNRSSSLTCLLLAVAIAGSAGANADGKVLTANLLVPADHDGSPFAVLLHFSAPIDNKLRHVKQAFTVT